MMRVTDAIRGAPRGTADEAIAALDGPDDKDRAYVRAVFANAPKVGIDPSVVIAQAFHETRRLTWPRWTNDHNPSGIGIPSGDTPQPFPIPTAEAAAAIHLAALMILTTRSMTYGSIRQDIPDEAEAWLSTVWMDHVDAGPPVQTVADLNIRYPDRHTGPHATWAWDPDYARKVVAMGNAIFDLPNQGEETPVPDKPIIMLVAGHRNLSGGNPEETALTPFLARDTLGVLRRLGYETSWWQQVDGDADPDDTQGGLDKVASGVNQWAARQASDNLVLLDLHYEGSPARGVFAIIPNRTGLSTGAPVPQHPNDTWEGNPLDRRLGLAIAKRISERTGLPLRNAREPGLMDERQTGVGGQGYRLGMYAWTSPQQSRMVRLVVEHGSHTQAADRAIIFQDDFSDKCAEAIGQAMQDVFGAVEEPPPSPPPAPTQPPKHPIPGPIRTQFVNGVLFVALDEGKTVKKTLARATAPREWADMAAPFFPLRPKGSSVTLAYACIGTDDSMWFVLSSGERIPADAFTPAA